MTIHIPLDPDTTPFPASPSFLKAASDHREVLDGAVKAIMKAKRIAVVCGEST